LEQSALLITLQGFHEQQGLTPTNGRLSLNLKK